MTGGARPDAKPTVRHVVLAGGAAVAVGMMATSPGWAGEGARATGDTLWR
jgi:hypothetical protein